MSRSVIVIGAGLAGLLAALRHARDGAEVTVLEAAPHVGGAIAAVDVAGIEVNAGAEAFSRTSGAVEELLAELGLAGRTVSPVPGRGSRLVSDAGSLPSPRGGLLGIPAQPLAPEVRAVLGPLGALRAAAERALPAGYGLTDGVSIGRYVRRRMGRRVAERLVAPVVGGVHSADAETVELSAIQPRLGAAVREHGSLAAAVRALRPGTGTAGTAVRSLTPTMAELPRALEAELRRLGVSIRTGVTAVEVSRDAGSWRVAIDDGTHHRTDDASCLVEAESLVVATGPGAARDLLEDAAPEIAAAIPEAPSAPVRLVVLALDAPALDEAASGTGALVAPGTRAVAAKALTHASAKWAHVREAAQDALGPHGHVVRLSYGRPGEQLPADDDALVDRALADASAILRTELTRENLRGARTITWHRSMHQALPGHRDALEHLAALLAAREDDLELLGSWRDGTGLDAIAAAERDRRATARTLTPTEGTPR